MMVKLLMTVKFEIINDGQKGEKKEGFTIDL